MNKAIVLIGPMGVGKTTIGKKLSKRLNRIFVDTDDLIAKQFGNISDIFAEKGEAEFRRLEEQTLANVLNHDNVVSTGGGVVLSEANQDLLKNHLVIYLATNGKHIGARLVGGNRPLLKEGLKDWKIIYEERKPLYEMLATISIDTSDKSLKTILDEIEQELSKHE